MKATESGTQSKHHTFNSSLANFGRLIVTTDVIYIRVFSSIMENFQVSCLSSSYPAFGDTLYRDSKPRYFKN